ncbi:hypothetical protein ACHAXS_012963 [Conticribra weissflogii]
MGLTQTKLHWTVLAEDWSECLKRINGSKGKFEARTQNPCGDLPLHLACYGGQAPPRIIRALIDAYPESIRIENKAGRRPLELAAINYRLESSHRRAVLAALRWHRTDTSVEDSRDESTDDDLFSSEAPDQIYSASSQCIICAENPSGIALIPCGHVCLCINCVRDTMMQVGLCPVDRCEVKGLYRLKGDEIVSIHDSSSQNEISVCVA